MRLAFTPNATFKATVIVPVAGQEDPSTIDMEFKYLTIDQMRKVHGKFSKAISEVNQEDPEKAEKEIFKLTADHILAIANGWEFEEEFNQKNIISTLNFYGAFYLAVLTAQNSELVNKRAKI